MASRPPLGRRPQRGRHASRQRGHQRRSHVQGSDGPLVSNLPVDDTAERAVLGACLLSDIAIETVTHLLEPADFVKMAHQAIYAAIITARSHGARPDILAIHRTIEPGVTVDLEYLHELITDTPSI